MALSSRTPRRWFPFALFLVATLSLQWPAKTENTAEEVGLELQKDSFCALEWSIAEFKWNFNRQFNELLFEAQLAQRANGNHLDPVQIAQVLENALAQARKAIAVQEMEECLLTFYRAAGLTNKFQTLRNELQTKNPDRIVLTPERRFVEQFAKHQADTGPHLGR